MPLTDKEKKFAFEYIRNGGNGIAAAVSAGYSDDIASAKSAKLLRSVSMQRELQRIRDASGTRFVMSLPEVLERLTALAINGSSEKVQMSALDKLMKYYGAYISNPTIIQYLPAQQIERLVQSLQDQIAAKRLLPPAVSDDELIDPIIDDEN
jgi:hypothetical protein